MVTKVSTNAAISSAEPFCPESESSVLIHRVGVICFMATSRFRIVRLLLNEYGRMGELTMENIETELVFLGVFRHTEAF